MTDLKSFGYKRYVNSVSDRISKFVIYRIEVRQRENTNAKRYRCNCAGARKICEMRHYSHSIKPEHALGAQQRNMPWNVNEAVVLVLLT